MMKRAIASFFLAFFSLWAFAGVADARPAAQSYRDYAAIVHAKPIQLAQLGGGLMFPGPGTAHSAGGARTCTDSTASGNFLARTSGLSNTEKDAYCTMIKGLEADSIITGTMNGANSGAGACGSILDVFYVFATNNKTNAYLNLCGTSYTATETATITCTVDVGCAGDGATGFLNTGFNPSFATTPNYVLNSATVAAYIQTNRTTGAVTTAIGMGDGGSNFTFIAPLRTGPVVQFDVNSGGFPTLSNSTAMGAWVVTRSSSTVTTVYENAATTVGTGGDTSAGVVSNTSFYIAALNNAGTAAQFSTDQLSFAALGAKMTSTQAFNFNARINQFMVDIGGPHVF